MRCYGILLRVGWEDSTHVGGSLWPRGSGAGTAAAGS